MIGPRFYPHIGNGEISWCQRTTHLPTASSWHPLNENCTVAKADLYPKPLLAMKARTWKGSRFRVSWFPSVDKPKDCHAA